MFARLMLLALLVGVLTTLAAPALAVTTTCAPGTYTTGPGRVNARAGATTTATIRAVVPAGTRVTVTGSRQGTLVAGSTLWCQATYNGLTVYIHSSLLTAGGVAVTTSQPAVTGSTNLQSPAPQPDAGASFVCPANCDGARAMGLTARQAATCPRLDRDHDGVACYGD